MSRRIGALEKAVPQEEVESEQRPRWRITAARRDAAWPDVGVIYGPSPRLRRWWMTCMLLIGTTCLGGCMLIWDMPTRCDADEWGAVRKYVQASGTVPESAVATGLATHSRRFLDIVGVEDRAIQDEIVAAAAEARRLHSTKPVVVIFHAGPVVKRADGGATFARDTWAHALRRETIP